MGPKITHTKFINRFNIISAFSPLYPLYCKLWEISKSPKNNIALPARIVKKIPNLLSVKRPIAAIIKHGVAHPKSGRGKDLSNSRYPSL